jgi:hypothetical protein
MPSIDDELTENVMAPWHEACRGSEYPWLATPKLRQTWYDMSYSEQPQTAFVGAFGLCRCSHLDSQERLRMEK